VRWDDRSQDVVVRDVLHIDYVSDFGIRLKLEALVSAKDKVNQRVARVVSIAEYIDNRARSRDDSGGYLTSAAAVERCPTSAETHQTRRYSSSHQPPHQQSQGGNYRGVGEGFDPQFTVPTPPLIFFPFC